MEIANCRRHSSEIKPSLPPLTNRLQRLIDVSAFLRCASIVACSRITRRRVDKRARRRRVEAAPILRAACRRTRRVDDVEIGAARVQFHIQILRRSAHCNLDQHNAYEMLFAFYVISRHQTHHVGLQTAAQSAKTARSRRLEATR